MARIRLPAWMLPHRVTVEAYRGWNDYEPARNRPCFVGERLGSGGPVGTERVGYVTVVFALQEHCPAGSRVTLADGRRGYASAVVRHDGGGLPTPDHLEVAVSVAGAYGPAFGETVVLLRRTRVIDGGGSTRYRTTEHEVAGVAVRALTSSESEQGTATTVTDTLELILPPDTQVSTADWVRVRGLTYEVDGTPEVIDTSTSDAEPGVKIIAKRRH